MFLNPNPNPNPASRPRMQRRVQRADQLKEVITSSKGICPPPRGWTGAQRGPNWATWATTTMLYHGRLCRSTQEKGGERHKLHTRRGRGKVRRARSSDCTVDLLVSIPGWNSKLRSKSSLRKSNKGSVAALVKLLCAAPQPPSALVLVPCSACRKLNKGIMPVDASSFSISPQTKPYPKQTKTDNKI